MNKRTVAIFRNGSNQAIRLPKEFEYEGVSELEATKEGDVITLRPKRPSWESFFRGPKADPDFLLERPKFDVGERRQFDDEVDESA